ncbi:MAG: hypothetical protein C0490_00160 [Marivirga sp.]|nr:hypothetical protein [Marivirga sp.]
MKISGYTYVRNGLQFCYPFLEAIQSVLPIVDEFIVVLGDSTDGSREGILSLGSEKIRIVDSVWNLNVRKGGKLFAQQSNIGLDEVKGDWVIHVQADEVIHENDLSKLKDYITEFDKDKEVEGLLFPFLNFRGDFEHIQSGRSRHRYEIRAFRNNPLIRSYRDSQGFRKYTSMDAYNKGEKGKKLKVVKVDIPVFHYSYVRHPKAMQAKARFFTSFYYDESVIEKEFKAEEFDYNKVDRLERYTGSHPQVMHENIRNKNWDFTYDPSKRKFKWRHEILNKIEDLTGWRIGEYKNYILLKGKKAKV